MNGAGVRLIRLRTAIALATFAGLALLTAALATGCHLALQQADQRLDRFAMETQEAAWQQVLEAELQSLRSEATAITRNGALREALAGGEPVAAYADPLHNRLTAAGVASGLVIHDADGERRFDSVRENSTDLSLVRATLEDGRIHQGLHRTPDGRYYAGLTIPLYDQGELVGVVVPLQSLTRTALDTLGARTDTRAVLLDTGGRVEYTAPAADGPYPGPILNRAGTRRTTADGRHELAVHLPLRPFGGEDVTGNVVIIRDITDSVTTQRFINTATRAAAIVALLLIGWALYFWLGRALQPLREAVATLEDVGQGRFTTSIRRDSRLQEVASLQGATLDMVERLQRMLEVEEDARLAFLDPLTGLANRRLLHLRLEHAIRASEQSGRHAALLLIDLDNFKTLNDTRGHSVGDRLLTVVAQRLQAQVRPQDTVARIGGDEFVVLLEELKSDQDQAVTDSGQIATKLLEQIREPLTLDGIQHVIQASIGVSVFPQGADTAEELFKQVDFAMYQAKHHGGDTMRFQDPEMQRQLQRRAELERALRDALDAGELVLHLQPQVDTDGNVIGAEGLMRWNPGDPREVSPAEFIPVAEQSGQIITIGRVALRQACEHLARWRHLPGAETLQLAVNLSAAHLRDARLLGEVRQLLDETGAPPQRLTLEITESVMAEESEQLMTNLQELRALGIGLALDDFGTGYSSLGYLKRLPVTELKIDRSFVRDLEHDPGDAGIVTTILAIARTMELDVVAEGVETPAQQDFLRQRGCRRFQGFLFHRAMPAQGLEALLP
ncbi:bifunctional diguanylate cyclase/phosphodiesterase [Thioalkalivibrio sp. ALJ24]|uniref:putative bifunctional diguanylate cyclase/phosphodiesterase n=1 Tax=Thioalkalivibrio sp. ALJ24 TaxID=545276 RepID=UPI00039994BD|nr:EAL domain-containing protein [Thioalkalivibrio sp. ALJ24]